MNAHSRCAGLILAGSVLFFVTSHAQDAEYVFQPVGGVDPFMSASIVLDSDNNADGTTADIVSAVFVNEYTGVWDVNLASLIKTSDPALTWNASEITGMDIFAQEYYTHADNHTVNAFAQTDFYQVSVPDEGPFGDYGSWVRDLNFDVPDTFSTLPVLFLTLGGLAVWARKCSVSATL